jgi:hypothetical protein
MASKIKDISRTLQTVRATTKAEIATKLAEGLPIAGIKDGKMVVEQLVQAEALQFVEKAVPASPIAVTSAKHRASAGHKGFGGEHKSRRKSATAA